MKKIVLLLCSCTMNNDGNQKDYDSEQDIKNTGIVENEPVDGEHLEAIFYNGQCYYGLPFGDTMREEDKPDDFEYIGTITSISDFLVSPSQELESSLGSVGDEMYHFVDDEGYHYFYSPIKDEVHYRCISKATTDKLDYYDQDN